MTIGVIDECRKLGLGTRMLDYTIDFLEKKYNSCIAIWLHVVSYNESAIKFYLKNHFVKFRKMLKFYYIDEREYDGILLYRGIGRLRPHIANEIIDPEAPNQPASISSSRQPVNDFVLPDCTTRPEDFDPDENYSSSDEKD